MPDNEQANLWEDALEEDDTVVPFRRGGRVDHDIEALPGENAGPAIPVFVETGGREDSVTMNVRVPRWVHENATMLMQDGRAHALGFRTMQDFIRDSIIRGQTFWGETLNEADPELLRAIMRQIAEERAVLKVVNRDVTHRRIAEVATIWDDLTERLAEAVERHGDTVIGSTWDVWDMRDFRDELDSFAAAFEALPASGALRDARARLPSLRVEARLALYLLDNPPHVVIEGDSWHTVGSDTVKWDMIERRLPTLGDLVVGILLSEADE